MNIRFCHFIQKHFGPTDRRTDQRTDTPSYRDARTHLKIVQKECGNTITLKWYIKVWTEFGSPIRILSTHHGMTWQKMLYLENGLSCFANILGPGTEFYLDFLNVCFLYRDGSMSVERWCQTVARKITIQETNIIGISILLYVACIRDL